MGKWVDVAEDTQLSEGGKICVVAEGTPLVVCKINGQLCAFEDVCPHAGLPLGQGDLTNGIITCPFHGYSFNVATGKNIDFADDVPLALKPVRDQGGKVQVEFPD